jgi:Tfp pilus assembly protein PilP
MECAEKWKALSKRERTLLLAMVAVVGTGGIAYIYPKPVQLMQSQLIIPSQPSTVLSLQPQTPVIQVSLTNVKDPFQVPPQYQIKPETKVPPVSGGNGETKSMEDAKPASQSKVSGIIRGKGVIRAIVELDGNSETVGMGDTVGVYKVESITESTVVLLGKDRITLGVGR